MTLLCIICTVQVYLDYDFSAFYGAAFASALNMWYMELWVTRYKVVSAIITVLRCLFLQPVIQSFYGHCSVNDCSTSFTVLRSRFKAVCMHFFHWFWTKENIKGKSILAVGSIAANCGFWHPDVPSLSNSVLLGTTRVCGISFHPTALAGYTSVTDDIRTYITYRRTDHATLTCHSRQNCFQRCRLIKIFVIIFPRNSFFSTFVNYVYFLFIYLDKASLDVSVRPYVRPSVRPSVHKKFLRFEWNLVCR